jgi:hypothetical protein
MDAQSRFDYLLWYFKEGHARPRDASYEMKNFQQSLPSNLSDPIRERAITIMESGIFHKGGLKGKKLAKAGHPDFITYPIDNLYNFIIGIAFGLQLMDRGEEDLRKLIDEAFNDIFKLFEAAAPIVILIGGVRRKSVDAVRKTLNEWKEKTSNRLVEREKEMAEKGKSDKLFASGQFKHFTRHIPDASPNLIATRVSELLYLFGKEISPETLRRKKKQKYNRQILRLTW